MNKTIGQLIITAKLQNFDNEEVAYSRLKNQKTNTEIEVIIIDTKNSNLEQKIQELKASAYNVFEQTFYAKLLEGLKNKDKCTANEFLDHELKSAIETRFNIELTANNFIYLAFDQSPAFRDKFYRG